MMMQPSSPTCFSLSVEVCALYGSREMQVLGTWNIQHVVADYDQHTLGLALL